MIAELVVRGDQNQNRFCSSSQIDDVDVLNAVTVCDLVEAETGQRVVEVVDGGDGRQLPLQLVQDQKLPFLENEREKNNKMKIRETKTCFLIKSSLYAKKEKKSFREKR